MREIKFRVWDKKNKKMRQLINIVFNTGFMVEKNDNSIKLIWVKGYDIIEQKHIMLKRENNFEIMQYTGLKDKNGKEIYEGDILLRKCGKFESICLVKFGKVEFSFLYKSRHNEKIRKGKWTRGTYQGLDVYGEIIGNIYNNPELLKEE